MKTQMKRLLWFLTCLTLFSATQLASAYYDPGVQRWINRDPLGEPGSSAARGHQWKAALGDQWAKVAHGPDLYTFVGNAPPDLHDPFGLQATPILPCSDADIAKCNKLCDARGYYAGVCWGCTLWCTPLGYVKICLCTCHFKKEP